LFTSVGCDTQLHGWILLGLTERHIVAQHIFATHCSSRRCAAGSPNLLCCVDHAPSQHDDRRPVLEAALSIVTSALACNRRCCRNLLGRRAFFGANLALGVASGFLLCALVFAALAADGSVTSAAFAGLDMVPAAALIFTAGVVFEELIFRGVILRVAEESLGTAPALMLSAMLFAASHLGNDGVTAIGVIAVFAGGITLGLTYVLSRNLWLPIGAHLGWNFALGAFFGTAVSGHEAHGAFRFVLSGPTWLSGGRFGPESSIYSMVFFVLLAIALWWHAARRSDWRSSQFRFRAPYRRMLNSKD
jgi:membrane protease YdiL (CAAX protease family)